LLFNNFELEDLYNSYEGDYTYSLSTACVNPLSLSKLFGLSVETASLEDVLSLELDYSTKYGSEEFLSALKKLYKSDTCFLSTTGAAEAIMLVLSALFSSGDTVIVQKPIYPSLYKIPEGLGCKVISWDFVWSESFEYNLESLKKLIKENPSTKALIINNPNNPCAYRFPKEELNSIIHELNGRYLISDEVFKDLCLEETPAVADLYDQGISISDLSKAYGLPGLRIGWIATQNSKLQEKFLSLKNFFSLRSSILSEKIASIALKQRDTLLSTSKSLISKGLEKVYINPHSLKINLPFMENSSELSFLDICIDLPRDSFGGLCLFARLNDSEHGELNTEILFTKLMQRKIFILPGKVFGQNYSQYFRFSVLPLSLYE